MADDAERRRNDEIVYEWVRHLQRMTRERDAAQMALEDAVVAAREAGLVWERIAEGLGVRRQSAIGRYSKLVRA